MRTMSTPILTEPGIGGLLWRSLSTSLEQMEKASIVLEIFLPARLTSSCYLVFHMLTGFQLGSRWMLMILEILKYGWCR